IINNKHNRNNSGRNSHHNQEQQWPQQPPPPQHLQTHQQSKLESEGQLHWPPAHQQQPLHAASLESVLLARLQRLPKQIKRQGQMLTEERDMTRNYWQLLHNIMDEMPDEMPLHPRREEPQQP
ncbi:MAG: hypothetical protein ACKPKO_11860, partial [Candidatus Fonsibacter sp.]